MRRVVIGLLMTAAAAISCARGDRTLDEVDPAAVAAQPSYDQVFAIMQRDCAPCHKGGGEAGGSAARAAAEDDFDADLTTCRGIVDSRFDIMASVEANRMPPGAWPRLTSEERLILQRWIDNGAEAPCQSAP